MVSAMAIDEQAEQRLYDAIKELDAALHAVQKIPRPKQVERILRNAREYAARAGIVIRP